LIVIPDKSLIYIFRRNTFLDFIFRIESVVMTIILYCLQLKSLNLLTRSINIISFSATWQRISGCRARSSSLPMKDSFASRIGARSKGLSCKDSSWMFPYAYVDKRSLAWFLIFNKYFGWSKWVCFRSAHIDFARTEY
jgi:hypothetical protein